MKSSAQFKVFVSDIPSFMETELKDVLKLGTPDSPKNSSEWPRFHWIRQTCLTQYPRAELITSG